MIDYTKLFTLLKERGLKKTELLKIISSNTLSKLGKNATVQTDIIDKVCLYLKVQPSDIMEVYEIEQIDGKEVKIKRRLPDAERYGDDHTTSFTLSEFKKYIDVDRNGRATLNVEKMVEDMNKL